MSLGGALDEAPCIGKDGSLLQLDDAASRSGILIVAAALFDPGAVLQFGVEGRRDSRSSTSQVVVTIVEGSPPTVGFGSLAGRRGIFVAGSDLILNPDVKLTVSGSALPSLDGGCASLLPLSLALTAGCRALPPY